MTTPEPSEWLRAQLRITQVADRQVLAEVARARAQINAMLRQIDGRPGIGAAIRREQLLLAKRNMLRVQARLWRNLGDIIRARRLEAAAKVIQLSGAVDAAILGANLPGGAQIAKSIADAELDGIERAMDRLIARVSGSSYVPLSQRVYNSEVRMGGQISNTVNSALASGLSAAEFARQIRNFINPNTPGGIRYSALRLSRTEINNAAHAVAIDAQRDKPWVEGMKWNLSGSHPRPDICDKLAQGGAHGVYRVEETPAKPHPHCFCFVTPETVSDKEFMNSLISGKYDDYLSRYSNIQPGQMIFTKLG